MKFTTKSLKITTKCPIFTTKHENFTTKLSLIQYPTEKPIKRQRMGPFKYLSVQ